MKQLWLAIVLTVLATNASAICVRGHTEYPKDFLGHVDMFATPTYVCDEYSSSQPSRSSNSGKSSNWNGKTTNKDRSNINTREYWRCRNNESWNSGTCDHYIE